MHVFLNLFAFEERHLSRTMDAWAAQHVPEGVTVEYEAWVTPSDGTTLSQAEEHDVFEAMEAPAGKLPSRNVAHDRAVQRGADVLVAADADAPPLTRDVLRTLTDAAGRPGVAAVNSNPVAPATPAGIPYNLGGYIKTGLLGGLNGQTHAITRRGWEHAGPFRSVEDTELTSVWREEEFDFAHRLRETGRVVMEYDAKVYNSPRRRVCRWKKAARKPAPDYCDRGSTTFAPRK